MELNSRVSKHERVVTVVITSYNAGSYLNEAVESVLAQTYTNWKMIIVDDASTDGSMESIRKYLRDRRIRVFVNHRNLGQTRALNVALKHVHTPFMVQLDSDDWFLPEALKVLVRKARHSGPDVALISSNIKVVWQDEGGNEVASMVRKGQKYRDKYRFLLDNRSCSPRFYRTTALRSVGGWPTDGPYEGRYIEDLRILFRLIPRYRFRWVDQTLYVHRRHQHNMTHRTKEMKETLYWLIDKTLRRWGGRYKPRYKLEGGYPQLVELVRTKSRKR